MENLEGKKIKINRGSSFNILREKIALRGFRQLQTWQQMERIRVGWGKRNTLDEIVMNVLHHHVSKRAKRSSSFKVSAFKRRFSVNVVFTDVI